MKHLGDFDTSAVIYGKFTTFRPSTGAAFTLGGTPALSVYKDNSTTQSATGVTLTVDFDTVTGLNHFAIDTSADGTFYAAGSFFDIVITTGTVDSVSIVGAVVASFTLRKTSALKPTTAGRTLDVSAGGEAGVDWANIGSPTTTVGLSGTTVKTATDVETDTADIQTRIGTAGAGLTAVPWNAAWDAEVQSEVADALTAASISTLDAAGVRTAVGLGAANLDTQLATIDDFLDTEVAAIKAKTDNLPSAPAAVSDIPTAAAVADAVLDDAVEGAFTLRQYVRLFASALLGKLSGAATATNTFRDTGDTKNRITATVDADGNRSSVTLDAS